MECAGLSTTAQSQRPHPDDMDAGGFHDPATARFIAECGACGKTVEMVTQPIRDGRIVPSAECPFAAAKKGG